ncbi:hypothetical protein FBR02_06085 [Anaerolineae bacterium CFX9]|nr:hypothetical protein [Anaerolineae bacterium CFX9]
MASFGQSQGDDDKKFVERIVQAIEKVEALDDTSMVFRYPVDKQMVPHLQGWKHLHLGKLSESFNELIDSLQAMSDWLSVLFEQKSDWHSMMQDMYGNPDDMFGSDEDWY